MWGAVPAFFLHCAALLPERQKSRSCEGALSPPAREREPPQPHLAGFYLRSDTHSPGAAGTARRTRHYSSDLLGILKNCMKNIFWKGSKYEQMKKSRVYLTSKIERKDRMCFTRYPCKTVSLQLPRRRQSLGKQNLQELALFVSLLCLQCLQHS